MSALAGRRFVVTGVASGIGAATAAALAAEGARVVGLDRRPAAAAIEAFHRCDLSDPDQIDAAVAAIEGPVDGLVNVAGVPGSCPAALIARVNLLAVRRLTDALLPRIADGGAVVNVASAAGLQWRARLAAIKRILAAPDWDEALALFLAAGLDPVAAYDFSKELVIVYSALVSSAQRHRGVRVNTVSPGAVQTPILGDFYATMGEALLAPIRRQAGGRDALPAEIAGPILFLLGPASSWVNGADLLVDGGGEVAMTLGEMARPPAGADAAGAAIEAG